MKKRLGGPGGFTLLELLVVVAIIGLLAALLLPAVQMVRERARSTQCSNKLRQVGLALHNYHSTHDSFPPGCVGVQGDPVNIQGWSWGALLLPDLDQGPLYDQLSPNQHSLTDVINSSTLQPLLKTPLQVFRCPSDTGDEVQSDNRTLSGFVLTASVAMNSPVPPGGPLLACILPIGGIPVGPPTHNQVYGVKAATSNYVGSFGDFWLPAGSTWTNEEFSGNGLFGSNYSVKLRDVVDGTSQTFLVGERSWQDFASIWAGTDGWNRCEREGVSMTMGTAWYPLNSSPDPYYLSCDPKGAASFSSFHPGGANFLFADGSVKFISQQIQFANATDPSRLGVYQRLARRNDGQPVGEF